MFAISAGAFERPSGICASIRRCASSNDIPRLATISFWIVSYMCVRGARTDRVDVDIVAGELRGADPGHRDHRALAAGVSDIRGAAKALARDRRDIDDFASVLLDHLARHPLHAEKQSARVDRM